MFSGDVERDQEHVNGAQLDRSNTGLRLITSTSVELHFWQLIKIRNSHSNIDTVNSNSISICNNYCDHCITDLETISTDTVRVLTIAPCLRNNDVSINVFDAETAGNISMSVFLTIYIQDTPNTIDVGNTSQ